MTEFCYLDKQEKEKWLPRLFDLLYENMSVIAPSEKSYDEDKSEWMGEVLPALDKAPRQIIMAFVDGKLAGYVQYYTRGELLMIEEVQLERAYHKTRLFYRLCRHLSSALPCGIEYVEAYAHKTNENSRSIMKNLGMWEIEEESNSSFPKLVHLRGNAAEIMNKKLSRH